MSLFSSADADGLISIVRQAAMEEIIPRYRRLSASSIATKSAADDLVTDADRGAEAYIHRGLQDLLPGSIVIGEEAVSADRTLVDRIGSTGLVVIVDPIDGTWNYAKGLPLFGVIVAVVADGETVFGLLYDPVSDDWISAHRGGGAFFGRPDGTREQVRAATDAPPDKNLSGYVPLYLFSEACRRPLAQMFPDFGRIGSLRCSCHEYRMLSEGHVSFLVTGSLKPWDHAAGLLIHGEAGGYSALIDGSPYRPTLTEGTVLVAPDKSTWAHLRDRFAFLAADEEPVG